MQAQIQELESCCLKLQDTVAEQALAAQQQLQMVLKQQDTVAEQTLAAQQQLLTERDNLSTQTHLLREQLELSQQQHQTAGPDSGAGELLPKIAAHGGGTGARRKRQPAARKPTSCASNWTYRSSNTRQRSSVSRTWRTVAFGNCVVGGSVYAIPFAAREGLLKTSIP